MKDLIKKLHQNFSPFPAKSDKTPAVRSWTPYRTTKIDIEKLFGHEYFAIACGFDNLEIIDIDNHFGDARSLMEQIYNKIDISLLPIVKTGGGGYHIYYKCPEIAGNKKLAQRKFIENDVSKHIIENDIHYIQPDNGHRLKLNFKDNEWFCLDTLIETRGSGGYILVPPSKGYKVESNDMFSVPEITPDFRSKLLEICRSLDEVKKPVEKKDISPQIEGAKPIDSYLADPFAPSETISLLKVNGWTTDNGKNFRRPGKESGYSATWNADTSKLKANKFYVFSSNAHPFQEQTSYTMAGVLCELSYNGDYPAMAKDLAKRYNLKQTPKTEKKPTEKKPEKQSAASKKWDVLFAIIKDWKLKFRFHQLMKMVEVSKNGKPFTTEDIDLLYGDIIYEMEVKRGIKSISASKVDEMIKSRKVCTLYNPIKEFFKTLPKWDGKDHFSELFEYIKVPHNENKEYVISMFKKHIIRSIRCAMYGEVNRMVLTFHGPQEIGKSRFLKWLVPEEVYSEEQIDPTDKDSILSLSRYLILNMDDIDTLNKKEVGKLKSFISKGSISKRVAFAKNEQKYQRVASFVASTNKMDILADDTNTRWIIVKVKSYNFDYSKKMDPFQIWAQAVDMLKKDVLSGDLTIKEKEEREKRNNSEFMQTSIEGEMIAKYIKEGDTPVMMTDVFMLMQEVAGRVKLNEHQFGRELKRMFGDPIAKRENGKPGRWFYLELPAKAQKDYGFNNYIEADTVEEDVPF